MLQAVVGHADESHLNDGTPTVDLSSGFHLRGGTFQLADNDIESLVQQFFGFAGLPKAVQTQ